jgi:SAM-dependent methyltransferase
MPKICNHVERCRLCGNQDLQTIIHLGVQSLTGVFPRASIDSVSSGPLELVRCKVTDAKQHCGLVQLRHSFDLNEMYGENYGYRSSLNRAMVDHLRDKVAILTRLVKPSSDSLVIDIGSNDGTLLSFYHAGGPTLVGIDPTSGKFRAYYRQDIHVITDFFTSAAVKKSFGERKADIITSIAMFYDLEDPLAFVKQIADVLSPNGVWHFEQSYLPSMLATTSYDTICHEHLEYYALRQIEWALSRAGLKIIDVQLNDVNGGSFAITASHVGATHQPSASVAETRANEAKLGLETNEPYHLFAERVVHHRSELLELLSKLRQENATVLGYGASTKGNVILQYCGLGPKDLPAIAEVNSDKFGCFTPGSLIPIISEVEAHARKPDYLLVLPWHFRDNLIHREDEYLRSGGKMIFPMPKIEVVSK